MEVTQKKHNKTEAECNYSTDKCVKYSKFYTIQIVKTLLVYNKLYLVGEHRLLIFMTPPGYLRFTRLRFETVHADAHGKTVV